MKTKQQDNCKSFLCNKYFDITFIIVVLMVCLTIVYVLHTDSKVEIKTESIDILVDGLNDEKEQSKFNRYEVWKMDNNVFNS